MNYPIKLQKRKFLDGLTGIKSSLGNIREVIALLYLLYVVNDKKCHVNYCVKSENDTLILDPQLQTKINNYLGNDYTSIINLNPLLTKQYEPLYVGVSVLLRLAYIKMDVPNASERVGGKRYVKHIDFSTNMLTLDLILSGFKEDDLKSSLESWLKDERQEGSLFEEKVSKFLSVCSQNTVFKLRKDDGQELYFQTEGLFNAVLNEEDVTLDDSVEHVGPNRIYRNIIKEGLEPWIQYKGNEVKLKDSASPSAQDFLDMMESYHVISNIKEDLGSLDDMNIHKDVSKARLSTMTLPLQIIFYGAPGTGKSHTIKKETKGKDVIRTTFHPDSDYSTFVGAYKPTMGNRERYADSGLPVKYQEDKGDHKKGDQIKEEEIVYKFVPQAFLRAYIAAWKKYCENQTQPSPQYLVIEEINRGNCAQIFGDLFQLLDRNGQGFSEYPINADSDISNFIRKTFNEPGLSIDDHNVINEMYNDDDDDYDVAQKVLDGEVLLLPSNLFIWATMNTSDQSLFPIDSAFKRRWEWRYVRISNAIKKDKEGHVMRDASGNPLHYNWVVKVGKHEYDWWSFLQQVNDKVIYGLTTSEDKKLGYFFCKANNGVISAETFTNKVIFYLWNEIFKDSPTDNSQWLKNESDKENPKLTFQSFYKENEEGMTIVNEEAVNTFMKNLGVKDNKEAENMVSPKAAVESESATSASQEQ